MAPHCDTLSLFHIAFHICFQSRGYIRRYYNAVHAHRCDWSHWLAVVSTTSEWYASSERERETEREYQRNTALQLMMFSCRWNIMHETLMSIWLSADHCDAVKRPWISPSNVVWVLWVWVAKWKSKRFHDTHTRWHVHAVWSRRKSWLLLLTVVSSPHCVETSFYGPAFEIAINVLLLIPSLSPLYSNVSW